MPWDERMGRRLKLRDLYVFKTVVRLGSMGKAATQLAVSSPAISKAITDLEHVLGVRLFDRSRQGVEPTRYGSALLKWSSTVFDNLKQGVEEIDSLADPSCGEVCVGTGEGMPAELLSAVIDRLSRQYPRLLFSVTQAATNTLQYRDLRERSVDLIFGRLVLPIEEQDLSTEILFEDRFLVVASSGSKWLRRGSIELSDLIDEPWCLHGGPFGTAVTEAFHARGLKPRQVVRTNSVRLIIALAATGRFLSVVSASRLQLNGKRLGLRPLQVDFQMPPGPIGLVTLKNRMISPVAQLFIDCARKFTKSLS
jgi:DNA-binding transcriptional LysR family regulator